MKYRVFAILGTIIAALAIALVVAITHRSVDWWVDFFIYSSAAPVFAFPAIYFFIAPWWVSWTGRWLMFQSSAMASVMALVVAATFFGPDYPMRAYLRLLVYGLLFIAFCSGCVVLVYQQVIGAQAISRGRTHRQ